jgi:hypothetical protein
MKLTTGKFDSQIKNLSKDQKLLLYTGLFIATLFLIYQFGIEFCKLYFYIKH